VRGGTGDRNAVDVGEAAQRLRFVAHPVLQTHHRQLSGRHVSQFGKHLRAVLALHGNQADLVAGPVDLARMIHRRDRQRLLTRRVLYSQATPADGLKVRTSGNQHGVMAVLKQPCPNHTADTTRAVDHEPHPASLARHSAREPTGEARRRLAAGRRRPPKDLPHRRRTKYPQSTNAAETAKKEPS
jgi:hypothetical protein